MNGAGKIVYWALAVLAAVMLFCLGCTMSAGNPADGAPASALIKTGSDVLDQILLPNSAVRQFLGVLQGAKNGDARTAADDCPVLTIDPPADQWSSTPSRITVTADYGGGCQASPGVTVSGKITAVFTNVVVSDTNLSADYNVVVSNLVQNGVQVGDGTVSGHASSSSAAGDTLDVNNTSVFNNYLINGVRANGNLNSVIRGLDINNNYAFNSAVVTLTNFELVDLVTANNCVLTATAVGGNVYHVVITGDTSLGPLDLEANVTHESANRYLANTTRPGSMSGYTVEATNLLYDSDQCQSNPVGGTLRITGGGQTYGKTFTGACDGDWGLPGFEGGGGGGGASSTRWGAYNSICCSNSSPITFGIDMDGVRKTSVSGSCSSHGSWNGYASTAAGGGKTVVWSVNGCGVDNFSQTWNPSTEFLADNCYRFDLGLSDSSSLQVTLYHVTNCAAPYSSTVMGGDGNQGLEVMDEFTIFMPAGEMSCGRGAAGPDKALDGE